ncbi:hypothetical protein FM107_01590 [Sphingobacterium sp. JB170]|nr:hypothetical protein FM107_01590 [Sphingobacterium sp. JB170]
MVPASLLRNGIKDSLSDFCAAISSVQFHFIDNLTRLHGKLEIMVYRCLHE